MNLRGLMALATLGELVGEDLWRFETADGRGIRQALDYLARFASGEKKWPHPQLGGWSPEGLFHLLHAAALKFPDSDYVAMALKLGRPPMSDRRRLTTPPLPGETNAD
jgi:hypothetical protein